MHLVVKKMWSVSFTMTILTINECTENVSCLVIINLITYFFNCTVDGTANAVRWSDFHSLCLFCVQSVNFLLFNL